MKPRGVAKGIDSGTDPTVLLRRRWIEGAVTVRAQAKVVRVVERGRIGFNQAEGAIRRPSAPHPATAALPPCGLANEVMDLMMYVMYVMYV